MVRLASGAVSHPRARLPQGCVRTDWSRPDRAASERGPDSAGSAEPRAPVSLRCRPIRSVCLFVRAPFAAALEVAEDAPHCANSNYTQVPAQMWVTSRALPAQSTGDIRQCNGDSSKQALLRALERVLRSRTWRGMAEAMACCIRRKHR